MVHPLFALPGVHVSQHDGGVITIECNQGWLAIAVLGTTLRTNCPDRDTFSNSALILYPEKGKKGLIALALENTRNHTKGPDTYDFYHGIFGVTWDEDKPRLNTDVSWADQRFVARTMIKRDESRPTSRLSWTALEVEIDGVWYTRLNHHVGGVQPAKPRFVPEGGDLLCRYLNDEASAEEVRNAAIPLDEKILELASQRFIELVRLIQDRDVEISILETDYRFLKERFTDLDGFVQRLFRQALGVLDPLCDFLAHIPGRWRPRRMTELLRLRDWLAKADERNRYWVGRTASS